jgi:hypothetical protein
MVLTWVTAGAELTLAMWEMLTPFATMLFAAFTMFRACAFCSAAPDNSTLDVAVVLIFEPSTATFSAVAEPMFVGPTTVVTTWLELSSLADAESDFCRLMLATVLVAEFFVSLLLLLDEDESFELEE